MRRDNNLTFSKMAEAVDAELQRVRDWESAVESVRLELRRAETNLANARQDLANARDALFEAHPELLPTPSIGGTRVDTGDGSRTVTVDVDDPDDVPGLRDADRIDFEEVK